MPESKEVRPSAMNFHNLSQRYFWTRLAALLLFLATASFAYAEEGYWVLVSSEVKGNNAGISTNGSGKSNGRLWTIRKNYATTTNGGVTMTWQDPPSKIKFGEEDDVAIPYERHFDSGISDQTLKAMKAVYQITASMSSGYAQAHFRGDGKFLRPFEHFASENINPGRDSKLILMVTCRLNQPVGDISVYQIYTYAYRGPGQLMEKTTEASDNVGEEEEGTEIPWIYIVGGGAAVAGGAALLGGKKKKKTKTGKAKKESKKEEKKEEEEKEPSRYRMILYKDFGNTLTVGSKPQTIGARIEEINVYGEKINRPDLTAQISIFAEENCSISDTKMQGKYQCCGIVAKQAPPEGQEGTAKVRFVFNGHAGTLINHVVFKVVAAPEIIIDEAITFEAGGGKTQFMEFGINNCNTEVLGVNVSLDKSGASYFTAQTEQDKDNPVLFRINITECGKLSEEEKKNAIAGDADRFTCYVSVTLDGIENPLETTFDIYRMHLGVNMSIRALKAYLVDIKSDMDEETLATDPKSQKKWGESKITFKLIAEDKKTGDIRSVLPDAEPVFTFEDVPEGNVLFKDKFGNSVPNPCGLMNFKWVCKEVRSDNTVVGLIHSGGGGLLPPNRAKAKVTLKVTYNGKTYEDTENVMIISQPFRDIADNREYSNALNQDQKKLDQLINMRSKIAFDPRFNYLMPFYYKVDALIEGYDNRFGIYEPDYKKMMDIFNKYCSGQLGYYFVNDAAWSPAWTEADENFNAFVATFASMEKSIPVIGLRIALAYFTAGASELVLMPYSGLVKMKEYVDKGGDSAFNGFVVASVHVFFWEGVFYVGGKALKWARGTQVGQQLEKKAVSKAKEGWGKLKEGYKKIKDYVTKAKEGKDATKKLNGGKSFSTNQIANKVKDAGKKAGKTKSSSVSNANDAIRKTRMKGDAIFTKESKFAEECSKRARKDAQKIYDDFKEVMNNPNATPEEVRRATLALQGNKSAQNLLRNSQSDLLRANYNAQMEKIYSEVDPATIKKLAKKLGVPEKDIKVWNGATGNAGKDLYLGKKIGADRDVTFQIRGEDGKWVDINEDIMQEAYAEAFNEYHYGLLPADKQQAIKTLKKFDQATVHGELGAESYGKDLPNIVKKELQASKLYDPERVAKTFEYKCKEWIGQGKACQNQAEQLYNMGLVDEAMHVRGYGEALIEEGIRQNVKQFKRILDPRITALNAKGVAKDYSVLYEKIRILESIGNPPPKDILPTTLEEARLVLKEQYGCTLEQVVEECADAIKEINEYL